MSEHVDVLVVGAGLSGIAAGYHLQQRCPNKRYAILEGRQAIGGTWDLFRYPGVRSDSDMYTLGYSFRPWQSDVAIADGASIRAYIQDAAREHGIDRHIRFGHQVERASWSSATGRWTVHATRTDDGARVELTCGFLLMCSGYYAYDAGYTPAIPGVDEYRGRVVHPQAWPEDLAYDGQRIVVIGSGATAVTLLPSLAARAAHVTMLQRSPSYVVSRPAVDPIARWLRQRLPAAAAHDLTRWKNVVFGKAFYAYCKRFPERARALITRGVRAQVPAGLDVDTHFNPRYAPWDQRLCMVPDADLFKALRAGTVDVVTDTIERYTATGLQLTSGRHLDADLIVTATGLRLRFLGGLQLTVDGAAVEPSTRKVYKGAMLSDVPNLAMATGYTNASWTLKCELVIRYVCRLLEHLDRRGYASCTPRPGADVGDEPLLDLSSGYVQRGRAGLPRQGARVPWKLHQDYARDLLMLRRGALEDGALIFARAAGARATRAAAR